MLEWCSSFMGALEEHSLGCWSSALCGRGPKIGVLPHEGFGMRAVSPASAAACGPQCPGESYRLVGAVWNRSNPLNTHLALSTSRPAAPEAGSTLGFPLEADPRATLSPQRHGAKATQSAPAANFITQP